MTWIKLDNRAVDHPKVASLTDRAFRWWVKGLSYASAFLTDGLLPPVFWKKVPQNNRDELKGYGLWDWHDPNFLIHDYHHHQSRKEDVEYEKERNRVKAAAYRDRKRAEKTVIVTGNVTGNASPKSDRVVPNPEIRDQRTDTEIREQRGEKNAPTLIARTPVQGSGAFEPGSLPRDHVNHEICGPSMRFCLKRWEYRELAKALNDPSPEDTRAILKNFIEFLEQSAQPIGVFSDVEKSFKTWLISIGRGPLKPTVPTPNRSIDDLPAWQQKAIRGGR